jgi:hypothetical protein
MPSQEQKSAPPEQQLNEMVFKKRTWAEMAFDDDEEEQQERLRDEDNKMKNILAARRFLYSIGQYELEEGEILE